jgi:hypothetical protein
MHYPSRGLEVVWKTTKNFNQEKQFLGWDFNLEPGKSRVLPTQPEYLLIILYKRVDQ